MPRVVRAVSFSGITSALQARLEEALALASSAASQAASAATAAAAAASQAASASGQASAAATQAASASGMATSAAGQASTAQAQLSTLPRVAWGAAPAPALGLGGKADVVVPLSPAMPDATYVAVASVAGGSGLLGAVTLQGVTEKTPTSVTVRLAQAGLTALGASAVSVQVVALRS